MSNRVKDQAEPGRDPRRLYHLLTASQVALDGWNVTSAGTQVHRHTRRALARRHTRAMRYLLRIRFDEGDARFRDRRVDNFTASRGLERAS